MIINKYSLALLFLLGMFSAVNINCSESNVSVSSNTSTEKQSKKTKKKSDKVKKENKQEAKKVDETIVTFVELGSVRCIPCKKMQPIMKEIEEKYGEKGVKVVFYDVWTEAGAPYAKQYKIMAIPTQVFLDKDGKEYFRHMGFFPKDELIKILEKGGIK
jgi:thioredoxin 1